jgi:hypothetical protein
MSKKCPSCSAELENGAVACPSCNAMQVVRRTPLGVVVGWLAIILGVQVALALIPVPFLMIAGFNMKSIPWQVTVMVIVAAFITAGMFWYSDKTKHLEWIPPRD